MNLLLKRSRIRPMLRALLSIVLLARLASAQTVGSSLQGTITDPSGAVIPNSKIEIRNTGTDALWALTSDEAGRYRAPLLPSGEYEVHISAEGFQPVVRKGIHLAIGQDAVIDVALELGKTAGEISVNADAARIN